MNTKLAVPIAAKDLEQAKKQVETAISTGAEILELRVDYLDNLSVEMVENLITFVKNAASKPPIIITIER